MRTTQFVHLQWFKVLDATPPQISVFLLAQECFSLYDDIRCCPLTYGSVRQGLAFFKFMQDIPIPYSLHTGLSDCDNPWMESLWNDFMGWWTTVTVFSRPFLTFPNLYTRLVLSSLVCFGFTKFTESTHNILYIYVWNSQHLSSSVCYSNWNFIVQDILPLQLLYLAVHRLDRSVWPKCVQNLIHFSQTFTAENQPDCLLSLRDVKRCVELIKWFQDRPGDGFRSPFLRVSVNWTYFLSFLSAISCKDSVKIWNTNIFQQTIFCFVVSISDIGWKYLSGWHAGKIAPF